MKVKESDRNEELSLLVDTMISRIHYEVVAGHFDKAFVPMSGGLYSFICASMCESALGSERVVGVIMPHLNSKDTEDATKFLQDYGIPYITQSVSLPSAAISKQVENAGGSLGLDLHRKIVSNVRSVTLAATAESFNGVSVFIPCADTDGLFDSTFGASIKLYELCELDRADIVAIGKMLSIPEPILQKAHRGDFDDLP